MARLTTPPGQRRMAVAARDRLKTKTTQQPKKPKPKDPYKAAIDSMLGPQIKAAQQGTTRDVQDLTNYNAAMAKILGLVGPQIEAGYGQAGDAIAGYGEAFSDDVRSRLTDVGQQSADQFGAQTGNNLPGIGVDVAGAGNPAATAELAYAGAYNDATSLRTQGAAFGAAAKLLPGAQATEGRYAIAKRQAEGQAAIAELQAKAPEMYADMQKEDREYALKLAKLDADLAEAQSRQDLASAKFIQAQKDEEFDRWYKTQGLQIRSASARFAVEKAIAAGKEVNAAASAKVGYLVDQYGNPILDAKGKRIKATKSGSSGTFAPGTTSYRGALTLARKLRGDPIAIDPTEAALLGAKGAYYADARYKGRPGVTVTSTGALVTDNPALARYETDIKLGQAIAQLRSSYDITRKQAIDILRKVGWPMPTKKKPTAKNSLTWDRR